MIIYCLSYAHDIMIWISRSLDLHSDNIITTTTTMLPYEEKVNVLNKQCFYRNNKMFCGIKSYNTCSNVVFRAALTQPHSRFATRLFPCR